MVSAALLEAVRPLRAAVPALAVERLVARLREQRPELDAGAEQVGEALRALKAEESEGTANAAAPAAADEGAGGAPLAASAGGGGGGGGLARWADAQAMLRELGMEAYVPLFEEEEMTSMQLLRDIAARDGGEKELMEAFKEMGIKKMGHRQTIVNAVLGLLP